MIAKLIVHEGRNEKGRRRWYVQGRAANGEVVFTTQGYVTKWNAQRAARALARRMNPPPTIVGVTV